MVSTVFPVRTALACMTDVPSDMVMSMKPRSMSRPVLDSTLMETVLVVPIRSRCHSMFWVMNSESPCCSVCMVMYPTSSPCSVTANFWKSAAAQVSVGWFCPFSPPQAAERITAAGRRSKRLFISVTSLSPMLYVPRLRRPTRGSSAGKPVCYPSVSWRPLPDHRGQGRAHLFPLCRLQASRC